MKIGCYGASLDPITNGHVEIIRQALELVDKLIIGIGTNPDKINKYMFSIEERVLIAKEALKEFGDKVEVDSFEDLFLIDFAKKKNASVLIRGLRNEKDFQDELSLNNLNKELNPNINTIFLMADKKNTEVSSSIVKSFFLYKNFDRIAKSKIPNISYQYLLREKIISLFSNISKDILNEILKKNLNKYIENNLPYHNLEHIYKLLDRMDSLEINLEDKKILYLASLYHDIIYSPKDINGVNEQKSVDYFLNNNCISISSQEKTRVSNIILSTIKHRSIDKNDKLIQTFLDLDLLILASDEYSEYMNSIRSEYSFVPDKLYKKERSKILKNFLKRDRIYFTEEFSQYEKKARENLLSEIKHLAKK